MDEAIRSVEATEGLRVTWNVFPNSKAEAPKNIIPLAFVYKPMHGYHDNSLLQVNYAPVRCTKQECGSILTSYSPIDFTTRNWTCLFCNRINILPPHYRDITQETLPYELIPGNSSVYYRTSKVTGYVRTYWFVIDACTFDEERHLLMKDILLTTLEALPEDCLIGVMRYSANIEIFSLDSSNSTTVHVFPSVSYTPSSLQKALTHGAQAPSPLNKFTKRKSESIQLIRGILKTLQQNIFPVSSVERPKRCTGSAVLLASSIVQSTCQEGSGHILLYTQGPCTFGPGAIASLSLKDPIRTNKSGLSKLFSSENIYDTSAAQLGKKGHTVDIIAAGIDDFGYSEMRALTEKTGGLAVFARDFDPYISKESIKRMFSKNEENLLNRVFDGRTSIKFSRGYVLKNVLGHGVFSEEKKSLLWREPALFKGATQILLMEITEDLPVGAPAYVQITTKFTDSSGESFERVTTLARSFADASNPQQLIMGFDQEAAAVFKAKELCINADNGDGLDVIRQADRSLIRFMQRFCTFQRDAPSSVKSSSSFSFFPELIFFLRRLPALHTDGLSYDEVAYQRTVILAEDVPSVICIMRPPLVSFHYTGDRCSVELDSKSLQPDVSLLVDTFHDVVIWRGKDIVAWIEAGIKDSPEYWYFRDMLKTVEQEAKHIVENRLPVPKFTVCNQNSSQERILLCKVNPSSSVANASAGASGQMIVTEDIDFARFFEYLLKIVVSS
ncbi:protein transport protein SEC23 [Nematocida sp. LUAm3]|nr:protein transport protein SEC23 [Nematocida sp. LUAm3]KAI5173559.1 protein transport protein SEC23 [Nematocida sp. LUAm2]KAI5176780.1 protein transport protein SEC23 [Nematocida sp. LUAm1]